MDDSNSDDDTSTEIPLKTLTTLLQLEVDQIDMSHIKRCHFRRALRCYPDTVLKRISDLDNKRFGDIPERLQQERASGRMPGLQSRELSLLSHWT